MSRPSRRALVRGLTASLSAGALIGCGEEPLPPMQTARPPSGARPVWDPGGILDLELFSSIAATDPTQDRVILAARTSLSPLDLEVVAFDGASWVAAYSRGGLAPDGRSARILVEGLQPDTAHGFVFRAPDGRRSEVGCFRTAPGAGTSRPIVLGASSCLGYADPSYACLGAAAQMDLDLFLMLGDFVYPSVRSLPEYRALWDRQLAKSNVRALMSSVALAAVWDDHEVANDWTLSDPVTESQVTVTEAQVRAARLAFEESLPQTRGSGLWRALAWGDVLELILLDCRGERAAGQMISEEQLSFVEARLADSQARFKLVLTSVHAADHREILGEGNAIDRWQGYPAQRARLIAAAEASPGALFITGDMHYPAIQRLAPAGQPGASLREICAGPAGSEIFDIAAWAAEEKGGLTDQYELVAAAHSFSRIALDPATGVVLVEIIDGAGAVVGRREIVA